MGTTASHIHVLADFFNDGETASIDFGAEVNISTGDCRDMLHHFCRLVQSHRAPIPWPDSLCRCSEQGMPEITWRDATWRCSIRFARPMLRCEKLWREATYGVVLD